MNEYYFIFLYLVQVISLYNVMAMGWNIKKIGVNTYELTTTDKNIGNIKLRDFLCSII